jgi:hypothetical protein
MAFVAPHPDDIPVADAIDLLIADFILRLAVSFQ